MCYFCVCHFHTVWYQHNERVTGNSYANDFGILLRRCARKIMKIRQSNKFDLILICKSHGEKSVAPFYVDTVDYNLPRFWYSRRDTVFSRLCL